MRKKLLLAGLAVACVAFFVGEYACFNHQASADLVRYDKGKTDVPKSVPKKTISKKQQEKENKKMLANVSSNDRITKPEFANVNAFISAMAQYFNHQESKRGLRILARKAA